MLVSNHTSAAPQRDSSMFENEVPHIHNALEKLAVLLLQQQEQMDYLSTFYKITRLHEHLIPTEKPVCTYAWLLNWILQKLTALTRSILGNRSKPVSIMDCGKSLPSFFTASKLNMFNAP